MAYSIVPSTGLVDPMAGLSMSTPSASSGSAASPLMPQMPGAAPSVSSALAAIHPQGQQAPGGFAQTWGGLWNPGTPGANGAPGVGGSLNWGNMESLFQGIGSIGQLWGAFQQNRLARDQLDLTRDNYETNLRNQTKTYNTQLEDVARNRAQATRSSQASADAYVAKHRL